MSETPPTPGPSRDTLLNLKAMLPSLFRGLKDGSIGKRRSILKRIDGAGKIARPRKCCTICGRMWDRIFVKPDDDTAIEPGQCQACEDRLKGGEVAFVCRDKYTFCIVPDRMADMRGTVQVVKPYVMEQIEAHFKAPAKSKEKEHDAGTKPDSADEPS